MSSYPVPPSLIPAGAARDAHVKLLEMLDVDIEALEAEFGDANSDFKYSAGQPRDYHGRWVATGALFGKPHGYVGPHYGADREEALDWKQVAKIEMGLGKRHPSCDFDLRGAHQANAKQLESAVDDMAREYPQAFAKVRYIGTGQNPNKAPFTYQHYFDHPNHQMDDAVTSDDGYMVFSPKLMGDARANGILAENAAIGWFPPGTGTVRATVIHEFGHIVQFGLDTNESPSPKSPRYRVRDEYGALFIEHANTAPLVSQYAADGIKRGHPGEAFAEGFKVIYTTPEAVSKNTFIQAEKQFLDDFAHGQVPLQGVGR